MMRQHVEVSLRAMAANLQGSLARASPVGVLGEVTGALQRCAAAAPRWAGPPPLQDGKECVCLDVCFLVDTGTRTATAAARTSRQFSDAGWALYHAPLTHRMRGGGVALAIRMGLPCAIRWAARPLPQALKGVQSYVLVVDVSVDDRPMARLVSAYLPPGISPDDHERRIPGRGLVPSG